jgi:RND family efflux transporter MFP subunit
MNMFKPLVLALALIFLAALSLTGCGGGHEKTASTTGAAHSVEAGVITLQTSQSGVLSAMPGTVVAQEAVQVASRLMGYIKDIAVTEGETVKKGQRLFTIDPMDVEGGVTQARLGLEQAEKAMQDAKADYDRFNALYKDEVVSRQQYEKMKLGYDIAVSRAAQAKAGLQTANGQMRYAVVSSPINGVVVQKFANQGDIAAPGHPILLVENQSRLQVQTAVPEEIYSGLKLGAQVKVEVDGQAEPLIAKISRLSPAADPTAHTHLVKLDVSAPNLRSGAFARVLFPTGQQSVLKVPQEAVLNRAGITGVFVLDDKGMAEYRMVRTGSSDNGQIEILSGLSAGDRVVTRNALAVNNGDLVRG